MKSYVITTLGCKVNQCESAALGHLLQQSGARPVSQGGAVDLVIINTCAVTAKAAMQSRQAIRRAMRRNPQAKIIVTGCYAQTAPQEIEAIAGVDLIVGHSAKPRIAQLLTNAWPPVNKTVLGDNIFKQRYFEPLPAAAPEGRTRAFLKIQDGCDALCTYCIVPYARGRSRSMPFTQIVAHMQHLGLAGYREVVLTGIHIGAFGADFDPPGTLSGLLAALTAKLAVDRIRLSSIEPCEVDAHLLALMAYPAARICRHLHLPLQSGDNGVLKRMGRSYTREDFALVVEKIRHSMPDAAIGADVLVGFPGEDEAAFENTYTLIEKLGLTYLHVFPFSARPGTPAARYAGKVSAKTIKARCAGLRALGALKKRAFLDSLIGHSLEVLVETPASAGQDPKGLSHNYIPVILEDAHLQANALVKARVKAVPPWQSVIATLD